MSDSVIIAANHAALASLLASGHALGSQLISSAQAAPNPGPAGHKTIDPDKLIMALAVLGVAYLVTKRQDQAPAQPSGLSVT